MLAPRDDHRLSLRCAALTATTILVTACTGQSPAAPSTPRPSPTAILVSPSASAAVPTVSPTTTPTPTKKPTPTPAPTPKPITTGRWVNAGKVSRQIANGELVALRNGGALLIGADSGPDADGYEQFVMATEMWSPKTGKWRPTAELGKPRSSFAAVPLKDGRVLVAGGFNEMDASYSSAYIFSPKTESWSKTGLMTVARTNAGATVLKDGRVLVVGGYFYAPEGAAVRTEIVLARASVYNIDVTPLGRALATAEVFDPRSGQWTRTGSMRYARTGPEVATLSDGRVLVVGSSPDEVTIDPRAYRTAEIYDPATGHFTSIGPLPEVDRAAISRLGVDLPSYAPEPGPMGSLVPLRDGGAALIGNHAWWSGTDGELVRSFRLDGTAKKWQDIGRPFAWVASDAGEAVTKGISRTDAVVARLSDGSVLVAGGSVRGEASRSVDRYDTRANAWSGLPRMPDAREIPRGVVLADGSVLIVGGWVGRDDGQRWATTTYRFVPR